MIIKKNNKKLLLTMSSEGDILSKVPGELLYTKHKSLDETIELKPYFIELQRTISLEKSRFLSILKDTKNYKERLSAKYENDSISIFMEEYNYIIPELGEYYVITLISGKYKLSVYNESAFMFYYLSNDDYQKYYGHTYPKALEEYYSVEEIENLIKKSENQNDKLRYSLRKNTFKKMINSTNTLYNELKNSKVFIRNINGIYDNPLSIMKYYNIEDIFKCVYDEETQEIIRCCESVDYSFESETISITKDDIFRAFELGIDEIETICKLKIKYGSIDSIF